ncbi:hypothetical protein [Chitinophaga sp. sic0106]|uniref:hypothetical protein n=1 Tax=Chitinophaga sp. sic0106 TaxID=2854785 RepID=UPI001C4846C8|nr:hypothetical protein [Chitinophaga sp. sic0106]MBV7532387.1 hypothetical protein [Chitinophaga sp. sic0106]
MDWDEILDPFSQDFQQAMEEQLRIVNVQDGLVTAANDLIKAHFPSVEKLPAPAQKKLQRVIISQSVQMANAIHEAMQQGSHEEE